MLTSVNANKGNKIILGFLVGFLVLGAGTAFVGYTLNSKQDLAPSDSSASGCDCPGGATCSDFNNIYVCNNFDVPDVYRTCTSSSASYIGGSPPQSGRCYMMQNSLDYMQHVNPPPNQYICTRSTGLRFFDADGRECSRDNNNNWTCDITQMNWAPCDPNYVPPSPSPVAVSGQVVCQDPGGQQVPIAGAAILVHDSYTSFNNGQCKDPPCQWTLTTDSSGRFSQTVPFKNDGTQYSNGVDVRVLSLPAGNIATGQSTANLKPNTSTPVTLSSFATNCANNATTGCNPGTFTVCQNKSFSNTSGSYSYCGLTEGRAISNLNFQFTNCSAQVTPVCGNGVLETGETCDDRNIVAGDGCSATCQIEVSNRCGNSVCDPGETCDGLTKCTGLGQFTPGECRNTCNYCGDGIPQTGEFCDDGNTVDADTCSNTCSTSIRVAVQSVCGNGILEPYEECDTRLTNSCGPGGVCTPGSCICQQKQPGLCGSYCNLNSECPFGNVCYGNFCRLSQCLPSLIGQGILSGPVSGPLSSLYPNTQIICTNNGCEVVQCLSQCGAGGACPNGLACNKDNLCVASYCKDHKCDNPCITPSTALIGDQADLVILAMMLLLVGVLVNRYELTDRAWYLFKENGGSSLLALFDSHEKRKKIKIKIGRSRSNFENKMLVRFRKEKHK